LIGTQLDKYEVLQKVGEGGMATVYKGRHLTLGRDVAIKVLHPHLSASTRNRRRFAREARAIEHLRHDNILEIFDYSGVDSADCYIVTEFVEGETLTHLLSRVGAIPSEIAARIGVELAGALGYAHAQGILHRDLKPDNVMIRTDGRVKLMDFGIARFLDESQVTMTGALVGSPAFMSPEQAREEDLDARSDLFSLGTLLYHMVAGTMPFHGSNPSIILRNIIEGNRVGLAEQVPDVSASLADAVERLLSRNRDDRFVDARAVAEALQASLDEVGLAASDPRWSLARYLDDPSAVQADLRAFLSVHLIDAARARIASGDDLAGLRLINRLLTLEPTHDEALQLVHDLHGLEGDGSPRRRWLLAGSALAVLGAFVLLGALAPRPPEAPAERRLADRPAEAPAIVDVPVKQVIETIDEVTPAAPADVAPLVAPTQAAAPAPAIPAVPAAPSPARPIVPAASPTSPVAVAGARPADPVPTEPTSGEPACVAFRTLTAPADVYLDGVRIATTRDVGCHQLPAGTYSFVLRGGMVEETTIRLTLKPGERRDAELVQLALRPGKVRFAPTLSAACVVSVDGLAQGSLESLGYSVLLTRPDRPHRVSLKCGQKTLSEDYAGLAYPEVWFDGASSP
jgi:tRNA A-37 threonylcarbamoyl transferase component Bud32